MKLIITIDMGNAAFDEQPLVEVQRILEDQVMCLNVEVEDTHPLRDINGNRVGVAHITS